MDRCSSVKSCHLAISIKAWRKLNALSSTSRLASFVFFVYHTPLDRRVVISLSLTRHVSSASSKKEQILSIQKWNKLVIFQILYSWSSDVSTRTCENWWSGRLPYARNSVKPPRESRIYNLMQRWNSVVPLVVTFCCYDCCLMAEQVV